MLIYREKRKVNNKKLNKGACITQGLEVLTQIIGTLNPSYRCSSLFLFFFFVYGNVINNLLENSMPPSRWDMIQLYKAISAFSGFHNLIYYIYI